VTPAATLRILVRDFESDAFNRNGGDFISPLKLQFSDFSVEYIAQGNSRRFNYARQFFDEAMYGDCLIERAYGNIPSMAGEFSGFGAIVLAPEELLLSLRLFRPGDLVFVAVKVEKEQHGELRQFPLKPYRVISGIGGDSTRQFSLCMAEVPTWEGFAAMLRSSPSWTSTWFQVARRCFLYGSSDEFNATFPSEVDRVADYVAALEAVLVPETDFVSRRLRERAVKLLGLEGEASREAKELLGDLYAIRSTLVHGSPLSPGQMSILQDRERWWKFEELVRELLVAALKTVPSDEVSRRSCLNSLYNIDDETRASRVSEEFRGIKDTNVRQRLLKTLPV
jgi:hypothetical protein